MTTGLKAPTFEMFGILVGITNLVASVPMFFDEGMVICNVLELCRTEESAPPT